VRSQSGWRGPAIVIAQQRNIVISFLGGIVVLCHRKRVRLFERSSRDENPSPLLDDDAFLPFQGKGVDFSASSALTAEDADDFVQSPLVTEFMPIEFEDVDFVMLRRLDDTSGSIRTTLSRQPGWLANLQPARRQAFLSFRTLLLSATPYQTLLECR
jgi:hypothetical protein